jgi:hypothetical protein
MWRGRSRIGGIGSWYKGCSMNTRIVLVSPVIAHHWWLSGRKINKGRCRSSGTALEKIRVVPREVAVVKDGTL